MAVTLKMSHSEGLRTLPVVGISEWQTLASSGLQTADASVVTSYLNATVPDTRIFQRDSGKGSTLLFRLARSASASSCTAPLVIGICGRGNNTQPWERLRTRDGNLQVTITPDFTYDGVGYSDGLARTAVNLLSHAVDCQNCNEFKWFIEQGLNLDSTYENSAVLEAKAI